MKVTREPRTVSEIISDVGFQKRDGGYYHLNNYCEGGQYTISVRIKKNRAGKRVIEPVTRLSPEREKYLLRQVGLLEDLLDQGEIEVRLRSTLPKKKA